MTNLVIISVSTLLFLVAIRELRYYFRERTPEEIFIARRMYQLRDESECSQRAEAQLASNRAQGVVR